MNATAANPQSIATGSPDYRAVTTQASAGVEKRLGKPVVLDVRQLQSLDDWAFLRAQMNSPGGQPIDYAGTEFADSAAAGGISKSYVALLRRDGADWRIVAERIGPTDVIWETWSKDYGAPPALFDSP